jgi:hypothetical protein
MISASDILGITKGVTSKWTKARKAEERGRRSRIDRQYIYSERVRFSDVAHEILPTGYAHASGEGRYTVDKRQFYYACRDEFRERTGRVIEADYFSQTLLVQYMNRHPKETAHWKITASPRGTLTLPNPACDVRIPCGTVAIEQHLAEAARPCDPYAFDAHVSVQWPSLAEGQRYQGVLYIEKEGFDPQLREAKIAERFDIAIISCKGQSVVAARRFVDHVCRVNGGVPLHIAHDMDKSGFEIAQRLTTVSDYAREKDLVKYEFQNEIQVHDLGLRLTEALAYNLKHEMFRFRGAFAPDTIATKEEQTFLRSNRRFELNAFTAPQFIDWIETQLAKYLKGKRLMPSDDVLEKAYRRAVVANEINRAIDDATATAIAKAKAAIVPKNLRRELQKCTEPWDQALYQLVNSKLFSIVQK